MTQAQARAELKRLAAGLRLPVDDVKDPRTGRIVQEGLTEEQIASWERVLMSTPYERGRAAVTELIDTWTYRRWPTRGDFQKIADSLSSEGVPNAGAYSQDRPSTLYDQDRMRRAIEQHDRWLNMTDEEYMDELERLQRSGALKLNGG